MVRMLISKSGVKWIAVFVGGLLLSVSAAQEGDIPEASKAPLQAMQRLAPLSGVWDMTVHVTPDDGKTWNETPTQAVELHFAHKGFVLEEIPADLDSPGFHMRTYLAYDQYRDVYRKLALDDVWGIPDLYEGTLDGDRLVMTNLKSGTFFPLENGASRGFRLTLELKDTKRWMWVDKSDDSGSTWQPAFKIEYVPRD